MINPYDIITGKKGQYLDFPLHEVVFLQVVKACPSNSRWTMTDCDCSTAPALGIHSSPIPSDTHSCGPTAHINVVITVVIAAASSGALIITVARWMQGTTAGSSTRMRQWDSWQRLRGNPRFLWLMHGDHNVRYYQPVGLFFRASHKLAIIGEDFLPDFWTILVFFLVQR